MNRGRGAVAQLGERVVRNDEAGSSILLSSTMNVWEGSFVFFWKFCRFAIFVVLAAKGIRSPCGNVLLCGGRFGGGNAYYCHVRHEWVSP